MKILFFILGSIDSRIVSWGLGNMKALLEEDIVFFGQIKEELFYYKNKKIPIISFRNEVSISEVFDSLPQGWYPDVVCSDVSVLNFIPDIYKCPQKTVLLGRDSWGDILFNPAIGDLFDFFSSNIIDRPQYSNMNTILLPLTGFPAAYPEQIKKNLPFKKREIDVVSISSYDSSFYHDRHKSLYIVAKDCQNFNIKYYVNLKREELQLYYENSKIVLDWAHTLSNRSYEAALNGCLLFSHEQNNLMSEFWTPWKEYVPYNNKNVCQLINHYLTNIDEADCIISNMQEKFNQYSPSFGGSLIDHFEYAVKTDINLDARIKRIESSNKAGFYHCLATALSFNYFYSRSFPENWKDLYFQRLGKSLSSETSVENLLPPLIEACRISFLLGQYEISLQYLTQLEDILPKYAWTYYLQARIFQINDNFDKSEQLLKYAIQLTKENTELLSRYVLPFAEKDNICDIRRIVDFMWQSSLEHRNKNQYLFLLTMCHEFLGDIYLKGGYTEEALKSYIYSFEHFQTPICTYKICLILLRKKNFEMVLEYTEKAIEEFPYDSFSHYFKYLALYGLKKNKIARKALSGHLSALKSFKNQKKVLYIKIALHLVILLSYLDVKLPDFLFVKLIIKRGKKQMGAFNN